MGFKLFKRVYYHFTTPLKWNIGFINNNLEDIIAGKPYKIHVVNHPYNDRWFADPFILDVNDEFIYLLVEELNYEWGRGRISKLTIERKSNSVIKVEPILQLDSHLSFPAIIRKADKVFIYPENAQGRGLALYEFNKETNHIQYVKLISNLPLADAVITDVLGQEELFATIKPTHNGNTLNQYSLIENEEGITLKKQFVFPSNVARNAGDWFRINNHVYRPAQDCNKCYGAGVIVQEIVKHDENVEFHEIRYIKSTSWKYSLGCHTLNHYKGVTVVDVHGYVHPILGYLFKSFTPNLFIK